MNANDKAYDLGVKAGKSDGWMVSSVDDLKDQLIEEFQRVKKTDNMQLVGNWLSGWEETDHFQILYAKQLRDLVEGEDTLISEDGDEKIYVYQELDDAFWEGFMMGLTERGKGFNPYLIAKEIIEESQLSSPKGKGSSCGAE